MKFSGYNVHCQVLFIWKPFDGLQKLKFTFENYFFS